MRKLLIGLLAVLMMSACSDGEYDELYIDSQPGFTTFPNLIKIEEDQILTDLSDFKVECIRESDSARMTLSDCSWYEAPALDNLLDSTQTMLYVSWMDMDALMSNKQTYENYKLSFRCSSLWGNKVHEIVWNMWICNKKAYPQYCLLDGEEIEITYISFSGMQTPYITITLQ